MRQLITSSVLGIRSASLILACYWIVIFIGTHIPSIRMPSFDNADKVYHLTAFAGLGFLLAWALPVNAHHRRQHLCIAFAMAACYAIFDELTQLLVRGRTADVWDCVADFTGTLLGLIVYVIARRLLVAWQRPGVSNPGFTALGAPSAGIQSSSASENAEAA